MLWLLLVSFADAKKPKGPPPAPPVGWHREEGWKADCYYPPEFEKLGQGDRQMARQTTLEQIELQWKGSREDDVSLNSDVIDGVDTVLLGRPAQIEGIARQNLDQCKAFMKGGAVDPWATWLGGLSSKLTAGECLQPLTYTMFDYLDIGHGWQRPLTLCKGNRAHIVGSAGDKYRITDGGPWINVEGDKTQKATSADYPCNIEGCFVGALVARFTTDAGVVTVFPVGTGTTYEAPENGTLEYSINDTAWYDNKWFKSATIEDRTAITVEPGE